MYVGIIWYLSTIQTVAPLFPCRFLTAVPRVLAEIYHSLGTQLPEALVAVLPADFFSDDSVTKDSISPSVSSPPLSTHSLVSDRLQDLRSRSASKRRWDEGQVHRFHFIITP